MFTLKDSAVEFSKIIWLQTEVGERSRSYVVNLAVNCILAIRIVEGRAR